METKKRNLPRTLTLLACLLFFGQKPEAQILAHRARAYADPCARSVAIGLSCYQNPSLPAPPNARTDAEAFAIFFKTRGFDGSKRSEVRLLTDSAATLAQFTQALDWLLDESRAGDRATLFFSGAAFRGAETQLLFYDSPPSPTEAGSFSVESALRLLSGLFAEKQVDFSLIVEFRPFFPGENTPQPLAWDEDENNRAFFAAKISAEQLPTPSAGHSFAHHLQQGLLGQADRNGDLLVKVAELVRFARALPDAAILPGNKLCIAASSKNLALAQVSEQDRGRLADCGDGPLSPVVGLESSQRTDSLLALAGATSIYQDFVLALKLGHFLPPDDPRPAAAAYDSLLRRPTLAPLFGVFRRMFAAALQDETQQALNAYLNSSTHELTRRRESTEAYHRYPAILTRALELLGERHYLRNMLQAKRLYFEGLALRLDAQRAANDTALLRQALQKQREALALEPEVAFVENEIGVAYAFLGELDSAIAHFRLATELAPAWGIPFSNISFALAEKNDFAGAIEAGIRGIGLNPWNAYAYSLLGNVYQKTGDLAAAEKLWRRAFKTDPSMAETAYNIACLRALAGDKSEAMEWLAAALDSGFDDVKLLANDPDLTALRAMPEWGILMKKHFPDKVKD